VKKLATIIVAAIMAVLIAIPAAAEYDYPTTNDLNRTGDNPLHPGVVGPHVNLVSVGDGEIVLEFVNPFTDFACFERIIDGNTSDIASATHPTQGIEGPRYRDVCVSNGASVRTFAAQATVEVRLAYMSHPDWYFDWVNFPEVAAPEPEPEAPADPEHGPVKGGAGKKAARHAEMANCMQGGWQDHGFHNQGQCIRVVNTGKDSR
jgi:hypothetical protein